MQVQSLGWEDLLEKEMTTHSYSCWENPMDRGAWDATVHEVSKSQTQLSEHAHRDLYWLAWCINLHKVIFYISNVHVK